MREYKRILLSRKYLGVIILLIVSNILIFQYYNKDNIDRMRSEDSFREYIEEYKESNE